MNKNANLSRFQKLIVFIFNLFSFSKLTVRKYSDERVQKVGNEGFGCWYFEINPNKDFWNRSVGGHCVTYNEFNLIGFDLGHSWSNTSHDFWYVLKEAWKQSHEIRDFN